jgi:hypothetical protein
MILRRAKNNSLGLLDLFPQTENVLREMRFVIFPVTEHKLVIAQVDELGFALQLFGSLQGKRHDQCGVTASSKAS